MCISLGYPDAAAERALLMGEDRRSMLKAMSALMTAEELTTARQSLKKFTHHPP